MQVSLLISQIPTPGGTRLLGRRFLLHLLRKVFRTEFYRFSIVLCKQLHVAVDPEGHRLVKTALPDVVKHLFYDMLATFPESNSHRH